MSSLSSGRNWNPNFWNFRCPRHYRQLFLFLANFPFFCLILTDTYTVQEIFLYFHCYCLCWTHLGADATALTIGQIYLKGYFPVDRAIGTVEPAQVTGIFLFLARSTLTQINDWSLCPPVAGGARLTMRQCGTGGNKLVLF